MTETGFNKFNNEQLDVLLNYALASLEIQPPERINDVYTDIGKLAIELMHRGVLRKGERDEL